MQNPCFASDNYSSVHPHVLEAISHCNHGSAPAYGADSFTQSAEKKIREVFGNTAEPFFVFNGTGANVLALQALLLSGEAVLTSSASHIYNDEGGAPEKFLGAKIISLPHHEGKLTPEIISADGKYLSWIGGEHYAQPRAISIAQSTELGTVYSVEEIKALSRFARAHNLYLHVDGARLSNAAVACETDLRSMSVDAGVDVLSLGGTKNGAMGAEVVIFFNRSLASRFKYIRKQGMQLASKMRYCSVQIEALLTDELWRSNATRANAMAQRLVQHIRHLPGVRISYPVQANAVFVDFPKPFLKHIEQTFYFYTRGNHSRIMTSWNTTESDVDALAEVVAEASRLYGEK